MMESRSSTLDNEIQNMENDEEEITSIESNYVVDYISGKQLKQTPKELVRQRIARALFNEYGIALEDMEIDFKVKIDNRGKKIDIAIFHTGQEHTPEHLSRVVICRPEPKSKTKAIRLRDYEQAHKDLEELEHIMTEIEASEYGLWTNSIELFFLEKQSSRFETRFEQIGDWPLAGESETSPEISSRIRRADPEMLRITFRRCHNFIHGNEGMPKDAAFWQFLYLIFCKMHDENAYKKTQERRFWAGPKEQFSDEGRRKIRSRIIPLFSEVKQQFTNIFRGNEEITLSDRALAFMVSELAKYDFSRTDVDAKGAAYQEIVGDNLRGDRGQYFTPRGVVKLAVQMLDPKPGERVLDPACGTGGFLVQTLAQVLEKFRSEAQVNREEETTQEFNKIHEALKKYAETMVYGADFDPFLIKASQMNMAMSGDGRGHLYHINSLEFPRGHLADVKRAGSEMPLGNDTNEHLGFDIVMTNPPFGSDIPITDRQILEQYDLARRWEATSDGGFINTGVLQSSVSPEILFIERCLQWLKPGGRMAIVLPDGILGNPGTEYIRWWILQKAWVLASVDLPIEVFIVEANVNILTSVIFLKKKTYQEMTAEQLGGAVEYPIFMAVVENVGFDRRGNTAYKRHPDGEDIVVINEETKKMKIRGKIVERTIRRPKKILDDDLPEVAKTFREFVQREAEKYPHLRSLL